MKQSTSTPDEEKKDEQENKPDRDKEQDKDELLRQYQHILDTQ